MATSKKTGSSSESSASSTDSEAEGTGDLLQIWHVLTCPHLKVKRLVLTSLLVFSGIIKHQKKKGQSVKEGKKTHPHLHIQSGPAHLGIHSQIAGLQSSIQMKQQPQPPPGTPGFINPPVAALESSQILETSFDSLPPFGQPLMHLSHQAGNSSPAPPHLNAHSAGPVSPETHPFLNQHPVLTSPGNVEFRLLKGPTLVTIWV